MLETPAGVTEPDLAHRHEPTQPVHVPVRPSTTSHVPCNPGGHAARPEGTAGVVVAARVEVEHAQRTHLDRGPDDEIETQQVTSGNPLGRRAPIHADRHAR